MDDMVIYGCETTIFITYSLGQVIGYIWNYNKRNIGTHLHTYSISSISEVRCVKSDY